MHAGMLRGRSQSMASKKECRRSFLVVCLITWQTEPGRSTEPANNRRALHRRRPHFCRRQFCCAPDCPADAPIQCAGPLRFSACDVEQCPRSARQQIAPNNLVAQNEIIGWPERWAQEPSFRSALTRLGEGICKCRLLEQIKRLQRMKRFEVVLADLGLPRSPNVRQSFYGGWSNSLTVS